MSRAQGRRALPGFVSVLAFVVAFCASALAWAEPAMRVEATARQADGRILFAGQAGTTAEGWPRVLIGRLNADGTMDATFANGGLASFDTGTSNSLRATAIAPMPDGQVLVGLLYADNYPGLLRLDAAGVVQGSGLGPLGYGIAVDNYGFSFEMNALFVQPGGTIIAAGGLANGGGTYAALVRYDAMGQRDLA
ncbi:MAG: hypothetical protein ACM3SO_03245, partial [Betaproteobacteria bacterium]